jgi:hypothetical protein
MIKKNIIFPSQNIQLNFNLTVIHNHTCKLLPLDETNAYICAS